MPAFHPFEIRPTNQPFGLSAGREPAGPRALLPLVRAGWRWLAERHRRFEASRFADVLGAVVASALVYAISFIAGVLE